MPRQINNRPREYAEGALDAAQPQSLERPIVIPLATHWIDAALKAETFPVPLERVYLKVFIFVRPNFVMLRNTRHNDEAQWQLAFHPNTVRDLRRLYPGIDLRRLIVLFPFPKYERNDPRALARYEGEPDVVVDTPTKWRARVPRTPRISALAEVKALRALVGQILARVQVCPICLQEVGHMRDCHAGRAAANEFIHCDSPWTPDSSSAETV